MTARAARFIDEAIPRLESREFMIPGIVALLLLVITTNLSSMGIVREKELGTLEQLNVTPITRWELIVGKLAGSPAGDRIELLLEGPSLVCPREMVPLIAPLRRPPKSWRQDPS